MDRLVFDVALPIWQEAYEDICCSYESRHYVRRWVPDTLFQSRSLLPVG